MNIAKAVSQARWRAKTDTKRVEVYLPVDVIAELDAIAKERGKSRAGVIAALVQDVAYLQGRIAEERNLTRHYQAREIEARTELGRLQAELQRLKAGVKPARKTTKQR